MPPQQSVRRDDGVEFEQRPSAYGFRLPRQERALGVGEADAPSSEPVRAGSGKRDWRLSEGPALMGEDIARKGAVQ